MIQTLAFDFVDSLNYLIDFYCALYFGEQPIQFFQINLLSHFNL